MCYHGTLTISGQSEKIMNNDNGAAGCLFIGLCLLVGVTIQAMRNMDDPTVGLFVLFLIGVFVMSLLKDSK
jgi:sugar phosphate permease